MYIYIYMYVCMYVNMYIYIYMYVCMYVCMYVNMYIYMYIYIFILNRLKKNNLERIHDPKWALAVFVLCDSLHCLSCDSFHYVDLRFLHEFGTDL